MLMLLLLAYSNSTRLNRRSTISKGGSSLLRAAVPMRPKRYVHLLLSIRLDDD